VSVQLDRGAWVVRWRDASGRQRGRRFANEPDAHQFDRKLHGVAVREREAGEPGHRGGVYPYPTRQGTRWYFKARGSDGSQITRRGFLGEKAARDAKRRVVEQIARGEASYTQETFGEYWERWLERRRHYIAPATTAAYATDARKRLLPALGALPVTTIETAHVQGIVEALAARVEQGEISGKTVNNTLTVLTVCLNAAVKDGLIATNPAIGVQRFPQHHKEHDYLRLHEIPAYLDACSEQYKPLAALLIGTGARISEALALRPSDLELTPTGGWVTVSRALREDHSISTPKSKRPRSIEIGPELASLLERHLSTRALSNPNADTDSPLFIAPRPTRRRCAARTTNQDLAPPERRTVSGQWHPHALQDAGLRHMPLHALRHTAAAAWLAAGNPLLYVQQQLGHQDLATSHYYGHLERHHNPTNGAHATEQTIKHASSR